MKRLGYLSETINNKAAICTYILHLKGDKHSFNHGKVRLDLRICKTFGISNLFVEIIVEQVHICKESCIPDHCRPYALSDPNDPEFQAKCSHKHHDLCDRCNNLKTVLNNIDEAISQIPANNAGVIEELTFVTSQAKQAIHAWKAHILRNVNQDEARTDALDMLEETSVLLVQDWAMKFLPRKYRESQTDWFGKQGISWHITVAIHRAALDQEFHTMTFVHVFQSCNQDSCTVLSIMKDVVSKLEKELPNLESVYYSQGNAGCYHCGSSIAGASLIGKDTGVFVRRMDFSDPQVGKGACDRKAASIKSHMKIHLNTGNNIETGREVCPEMHANEMHELYERHHKVSLTLNSY